MSVSAQRLFPLSPPSFLPAQRSSGVFPLLTSFSLQHSLLLLVSLGLFIVLSVDFFRRLFCFSHTLLPLWSLSMFAHFTLPFRFCPRSSFFCLLLSSIVTLDCFFFACRYPFYLQFVFVQLARLFYFIAHPLLSPPHLFILLPSLLCLNIIFLFVDS